MGNNKKIEELINNFANGDLNLISFVNEIYNIGVEESDKKYWVLYDNVAKLLVRNKKSDTPMTPDELLREWDSFRDL